MCYGVLETHAFFGNDWQFVFVYRRGIVAVKTKVAFILSKNGRTLRESLLTILQANCTSGRYTYRPALLGWLP
jgi:hypothetical protein